MYEYRDCEDFKTEVNEWYDYKEDKLFLLRDAKEAFDKLLSAQGVNSWRKASIKVKREIVQMLVRNGIEEKASGMLCLKYIAEGCFGEVTTVDDHMRCIKENCRFLYQEGVLPEIYDEMRKLIDISCPANPTATIDSNVDVAQVETNLVLCMTIMYLMIESLGHESQFAADLDALNPSILSYLVEMTGRLRWSYYGTLPIKKILLLAWKCILSLFGGSEMISKVKTYRRRQYDLPDVVDDENCITSSPLDYHAFREDIMSRYPSYIPPPSQLPKSYENSQSISHYVEVPRPAHAQQSNSSLPPPAVHIATPAPSPPSSPAIAAGQKVKKSVFMTNQSFPFIYPTEGSVPESIIEAGELFSSRVRTTPAMVQLWDERDKFMQYERGWLSLDNSDQHDQEDESTPCPEKVVLDRVERFYAKSHTQLFSFINVALKVMLKCTSFVHGSVEDEEADAIRTKETNLKAISAIFSILLRWFKASHILKFEYFSTLLFDARYYLLVYKFLYSHNVLERSLFIPELPYLSFFSLCKELADNPSDNYGSLCVDKDTMSPTQARFGEKIEKCSSRYLFTMINILRVLRKIIKRKTQRIIIVAELPSETLRKSLSIYQTDIWQIVLDIFKEQVPYNGRKWKYNNMDLVSAIYLHCKAKLRDDWLAGIDVSAEVDDAYAQEAATRALTAFYNNHNYSPNDNKSPNVEGSSNTPSTDPNSDFFVQELSALSLGSRMNN